MDYNSILCGNQCNSENETRRTCPSRTSCLPNGRSLVLRIRAKHAAPHPKAPTGAHDAFPLYGRARGASSAVLQCCCCQPLVLSGKPLVSRSRFQEGRWRSYESRLCRKQCSERYMAPGLHRWVSFPSEFADFVTDRKFCQVLLAKYSFQDPRRWARADTEFKHRQPGASK